MGIWTFPLGADSSAWACLLFSCVFGLGCAQCVALSGSHQTTLQQTRKWAVFLHNPQCVPCPRTFRCSWPCQMLPLSQRDGVSLWKLPGLLRGAPCGSRQPHAQIWSVSYSPFTKGLQQGGVSRRLPSQVGRYLCAQSSPWALTCGGFSSSSVLEDEHITGRPSGSSSHSAQWAIGASSHVQLLRQASTVPASRCQE